MQSFRESDQRYSGLLDEAKFIQEEQQMQIDILQEGLRSFSDVQANLEAVYSQNKSNSKLMETYPKIEQILD